MGFSSSKSIKDVDKDDKIHCLVSNSSSSSVPETIKDKLSESITRIEFGKTISTGFFMKISLGKNQYNFLITNEHVISKNDIDSKITISLFYGKAYKEVEKKIKLDRSKRFIKCFKDHSIDASIIEILLEDNIPEDKYLYPDLNYENGYDQYIKTQIYTAGYPNVENYKGDKHFSSGKITSYKDKGKFNFCHNCSTKEGSSGSPLINYNQRVIGLHYGCNQQQTINHGTFIGEILKILKSEENKIVFFQENIKDKNKPNQIKENKQQKDELKEKEMNKIINLEEEKAKDNEKVNPLAFNNNNEINQANTKMNIETKQIEKKNGDIINDEKIHKIVGKNNTKNISKNNQNDLKNNISAINIENNKKESEIKKLETLFGFDYLDAIFQNPFMFEFFKKQPEFQKFKEGFPGNEDKFDNRESFIQFWKEQKLQGLNEINKEEYREELEKFKNQKENFQYKFEKEWKDFFK